uniref:Transmembrane protein n=1 Tax=Steinernema glaseri TaxID=37863 RepID=A0A1I7Z558_9BILA
MSSDIANSSNAADPPCPPNPPNHKVHCGCGMMHVRKASIIIGIFTIIGGSFNMISSFNTAFPTSVRLGMGVYNAVLIIFGCLLIAGVKKRKHHLLTPFIVLMYVVIATSVVLLVLSIVAQFFIEWIVKNVDEPVVPHYLDHSETRARIGLAFMSLGFVILLLIPIWYLDIVKKCYRHLKHLAHLDTAEQDDHSAEMQKY